PLGGATAASGRPAPRANGRGSGRLQRSASLDEKPHVVHPVSKDPTANLPEKEQIINKPNEGSLHESPTRYQLPQTVSSPNVARSIDERRVGSPPKDTSTKTQERPQVPPRVPLPARPYGERDPVPQIPVPPSQSTVHNAHRPPNYPYQQGGNKQPGPPRWPAYPRPPFGYGVPVGNIQVPTTPRPPSCFYKSERYEHGDSVETPEPCLNCTCQKGVLVCYLRVCPAIGTPAPGCFTARESGQCCPNVFCSGDKKSETTTTPPPPTDDDYYDYPATVDYEAEASTTTTTTTTTTTRRPYTAPTRRYSFAPKPVKRPYGGVHDDVELSARTPSVIVEQTETTTTEADVTTTTTRGASTTTTEEAQAKPDVTTAVPLATTFAPTTKPSLTTTTTPEDVVTVTATGIAPTATTPHSVTTFTAVVGGEDDDAAPTVKADSPGAGLGFGPKEVHGVSRTTTTTSPTTRRHETSASTKPAGQVTSTSRKPSGVEEGPKVVATKTTTTARPSTLAGITETPVEEQPVGDGEFVAGTAANEFETPVRRPLTEDEPANSVEDGSLGGRDSIMFVSSTPMPYELHHSFDLQDLNTVSGACLDEASLYAEGSAMLSTNFCNYCYCIRGLKRCVQPKCHLALCLHARAERNHAAPAIHDEGCYHHDDHHHTTSTSTTTEGPVVIPIQGCWKKGNLYRVGEPIPGTTDCETCYCSPRGPTCQRIECPPVALDCDPVIPRGHCCPTEYICNKTQLHRDDYKALGLDKHLHHAQALSDDHKDSQPLSRKSDDTSDYNVVPQPAYRPPATQETAPQDRTFIVDKNDVLHKEATQPPTRTTTIMPVTRFAPTPITKEKDVFLSVANNVKEGVQTTQVVEASSPRPTTAANTSNSKFEVWTSEHSTTTESPTQTKAPVYSPVLSQAKHEENQTEGKIEVNKLVAPSLALQEGKIEVQTTNSTKELQHDSAILDRPVEPSPFLDNANKGVPAMPQEGLHFSDLIDRLFFTGNDEKKEAVDGSPQTDQLRPVYGQAHLYNATSLGGASVIESRYPVKENDTLQPVYGTVPAYHRPTAESSIGKVDSLRPRYGKPPSFREESSEELISHMHTQVSTTAEVHYEPALSLDADTPSDKKSLTLNKAVNSTAENSKTQSDSSHQDNTAPGTENRPHISIAPKDLTPIYYDVRKYTTTTPSPAATFTTEDNSARLSTLTTSATTMSVYSTSQGTKDVVINATTASNMTKEAQEQHTNLETTTGPDHNIWELMFFNRSAPTVQPTKNDNATENNIWKQMFFNHSSSTVEPHKDNKTEDSNEITNKTADHKKPAEEVAITTSVIKVRVGNTLNVSIDNSNQSKYRNVEEDGIIVSVYPEHQMDGGVTDVQDMPLPGQAESRAISSGDSFKSIQHSGDKAKSPAELTQVISDIIKAHKSEEPEVITAPNIDFSKPNVMTVKVSPSNSFNVFSLILLDKNGTSERGTTSTTEPPVDNAPWAPMGTAAEDSSALRHSAEYANYNQTASATPTSTESFESQASLTVQTQIPSHGASEIISHSEKPALHSTFRIVPFLAEDAIFKPATSTQPSLANDTGAYPRIVNTDPRDTVEDHCFVDGHMFANGELIKKHNPCELCRCYYGRELCQQKNCPLPPSPACISEAVPGFCCPKYTCRPEDVYFPPDSETTPGPDNQVQQYTVNIWSTRPPAGQFGFVGGHNAAPQSQITGRKSTPQWLSTSSFSVKNSPTLKPYLLQRQSPHKTHDRFAHLHGTEEPDSYEETTPLPTMTTTTAEPPTSQTPSSSQLWNIFEVSGCNIYGRLYGVNEVVRELSSKCKACTCTSLGVQCNETC
ncbi:hypothetical protein V5799_005646, partial [Amblyomma americanum]